MRVLITGGAGFIGSHLTERLLVDGHEVAVIDDLSTGSLANLAASGAHPRLQLTIDTLENEAVTAALMDRADRVYHLAAAVGVRLVVGSPLRTIRTNVRTTDRLLELAARRGCPVLLASSSEVYGRSDRLPFAEDADLVLGAPTVGRFSYACSKAVDEFLALAAHRELGLPVVVARIFNAAGPRQTGRYGMVLPRFVASALAGEPLVVHGDGRQTRCFCHVLDVVDALVALADSEAARGTVCNVGSDHEISIAALAERVVELTGSRSPIVPLPYEQAFGAGFEDLRRRVPDIARARRLVGWQPRRTLDDVITDIAGHLREAGG